MRPGWTAAVIAATKKKPRRRRQTDGAPTAHSCQLVTRLAHCRFERFQRVRARAGSNCTGVSGRGDFKDRAGERRERFRNAREGRKTPSKSFLCLPFSSPNPTSSRGYPRSRLINSFSRALLPPEPRSRRPSLAGGWVAVEQI